MQLGETIATYDVALALRGESGKFDVTSPNGEMFHVTCKPDHSITNLQWSGNKAQTHPFLIRKVAEPILFAPEKPAADDSEAATQSRPSQVPFLIVGEENKPIAEGTDNLQAANPSSSGVSLESESLPILEIGYSETRPDSRELEAWVCISGGPLGNRRTLLTPVCPSFNQLDVEIRSLHARLDEIRYRARKKFYQAQDVAAGA